jgi:2-keto-4-pentenoate hydratase/2-oxohepta-3-ene-1,7-dioic acid hydratase in catechol pathway
MRFCSIGSRERSKGAIVHGNRIIPFEDLRDMTGTDLPTELQVSQLTDLSLLENALSKARLNSGIGLPSDSVRYSAPFYNPPKILGIGLNYREHAADLGAQEPSEPASFIKPRTVIIGPGEEIVLPKQSSRVTAEAELGVIIGKRCKYVREQHADTVVFGYVPIIDMTAEDILLKNPRFLTRAKAFDTFLSFGPVILTPSEVSDLSSLTVRTVLNGEVTKSNQIRNMLFSPRHLISFHSNVMTFEPGDIISTGTPGAVPIRAGDIVECRIDGFPVLSNPVVESDR